MMFTQEMLDQYHKDYMAALERGFQPGDEASVPLGDFYARPRDSGHGWKYVLVVLNIMVPTDLKPHWIVVASERCRHGLKCRVPDDVQQVKRIRCVSRGPKSAYVEVLE